LIGAQIGEGFYGPDGRLYEIASITSSTVLVLADPYVGTNQTGQEYKIVPTQSLVADLATQVSDLITDFSDVRDQAGSGKFNDGTVTAPGITFEQDQNNGLYRIGADNWAMSAAATKIVDVSASGIGITGDLAVDTNTLFVDASANAVGIGTTSPARLLHLESADPAIRIKDTTGTGTVHDLATVGTNGQDVRLSLDIGNAGTSPSFQIENYTTRLFTVLGSGNVGIGTSSPAAELEVAGKVRSSRDGVPSQFIEMESFASRILAESAAANAKTLTFDCATTDLSTPTSGSLGFVWRINNSTKMTVDQGGNLLVGTTTTAGLGTGSSSNEGVVLGNDGASYSQNNGGVNHFAAKASGYTNGKYHSFYVNGSEVGSISTNGTTTSYTTSSDVRLKENITDAPEGNIDALKVRSFDWKADGSHQEYGFIAQELDAVAPYAVSKGKTEDDMWAVDYSKLVPMLVKEIQDLKAEVAALKGA
jgi:hypothetical protein